MQKERVNKTTMSTWERQNWVLIILHLFILYNNKRKSISQIMGSTAPKVTIRRPIPQILFTICDHSQADKKCFKSLILQHHFATPIKLQSESMHFALQNPWFCEPICSILQAKMQGFAKTRPSDRKPKKIVSKTYMFCNKS